ncbi:MAG: extracellular solute-binding protein [Deltaproteobacteria bacterium]|nr:extracellular solute-binding protein [Deltaproteobacteria bacterium]
MKKNLYWGYWIAAVFVAVAFLAGDVTAQAASDWSQVVAAAKKEGQIVIIGPQGTETKDALTLGFMKKYPEIKIVHSGMRGSTVTAKVLNEQGARRFLTDIAVVGTTTAITGLLPADAITPIRPLLVGPNSSDESAWRNGGGYKFADNAKKYVFVMSAYVKAPFIYNPEVVNARRIKSWKDLLDPKWKGKIAIRDPRRPGGGMGNATLWYITPSLGKEFIRQLFTQKVIVSGNDRQILDFVAKGKNPIGIGPSDVLTNELIGKGLPLKHFEPTKIKEGTYITAGNGAVVAMKNAPHPNAARVYLDYLFSEEGQAAWSKGAGFASLRSGVPHDHVLPQLVPDASMPYPQFSDEKYVTKRNEIVSFLRSVMGRR